MPSRVELEQEAHRLFLGGMRRTGTRGLRGSAACQNHRESALPTGVQETDSPARPTLSLIGRNHAEAASSGGSACNRSSHTSSVLTSAGITAQSPSVPVVPDRVRPRRTRVPRGFPRGSGGWLRPPGQRSPAHATHAPADRSNRVMDARCGALHLQEYLGGPMAGSRSRHLPCEPFFAWDRDVRHICGATPDPLILGGHGYPACRTGRRLQWSGLIR